MISYARRKARRSGNCHFELGVAEALPFPVEHFDVVVSGLVMHHLPGDLQALALQEMWRVLRRGGKLLVAEAQNRPHGLGWRLPARALRIRPYGADGARARAAGSAGRLRRDSPWLRYVLAMRTARPMVM
jgi:ubiquinone/menaquinone biosynthesis C-methylase UbiE